MEQNIYVTGQPSSNFNSQQSVPNATAVLVLGIISIPTCCCYGIIGLICAIIALVLAGSGASAYKANPAAYTESSYKNLNAGRICAWVGVGLGVLSIIYFIIILSLYGFGTVSSLEEIRKIIESTTHR
ncbi:MAG: hypothetical protein LBD53_10785 [Tannerella sp.]|jgi:hypothetical protein|nr:hypothetical protein [Tannerella sp.]